MLDALAAAVAHEHAWQTLVQRVIDRKAARVDAYRALAQVEQAAAGERERRRKSGQDPDAVPEQMQRALSAARDRFAASEDRLATAQQAMKAGVR